jgi:hypothetical protein
LAAALAAAAGAAEGKRAALKVFTSI